MLQQAPRQNSAHTVHSLGTCNQEVACLRLGPDACYTDRRFRDLSQHTEPSDRTVSNRPRPLHCTSFRSPLLLITARSIGTGSSILGTFRDRDQRYPLTDGAQCQQSGLNLPWVATESSVVQGVEPVVVGQHDVSIVVQEQRQHVVTLLRDGVVQWRIAFRIL